MKLIFDDKEILPSASVYHNDKEKDFVIFNGTVVWQKDVSGDFPTSLTASKSLKNEIFVSWGTPSSGNVPDFYNLYRNGIKYKTGITNEFYSDKNLPNDAKYEYYATSVIGGQESNPSNTDIGYTKATPGSKTFTENGTFKVPNGITKLKICMISGGNGGDAKYSDLYTTRTPYGGKSGQLFERTITVIPGQEFDVKIGKGGSASANYKSNGGQGGETSFGFYVTNPSSLNDHKGEGKVTGTPGCGETSKKDGTKYLGSRCGISYGGQGTIFGEGGNGGSSDEYYYYQGYQKITCGKQAEDGQGYGAGGGGSSSTAYANISKQRKSGAGKQGVCIVSWGIEETQNTENGVESINNLLGYDVLDERFLNQIQYTTNQNIIKMDKPEYIDTINVEWDDFYQVSPQNTKINKEEL